MLYATSGEHPNSVESQRAPASNQKNIEASNENIGYYKILYYVLICLDKDRYCEQCRKVATKLAASMFLRISGLHPSQAWRPGPPFSTNRTPIWQRLQ